MNPDFSSYEAYVERYNTFYDEEEKNRPPLMSREEFQQRFNLLRDSYQVYQQYLDMGEVDSGANYYRSIINQLENQLAIADASDNFQVDIDGGGV